MHFSPQQIAAQARNLTGEAYLGGKKHCCKKKLKSCQGAYIYAIRHITFSTFSMEKFVSTTFTSISVPRHNSKHVVTEIREADITICCVLPTATVVSVLTFTRHRLSSQQLYESVRMKLSKCYMSAIRAHLGSPDVIMPPHRASARSQSP
jgi:hypothetical protein